MFLPTLILYIFIGFVFCGAVTLGLGVQADRNDPNVPDKKYHLLFGILGGTFWLFFVIYLILADKEKE
jgi:hypothetical protein